MCLATVYGKKQDSESILIKNASRIDVDGTTICIRDIMGQEITGANELAPALRLGGVSTR